MEVNELNKRIDALGVKNAAIEQEIQVLGLATLQHAASQDMGGHGDVMPLNRLINVLRRGQHQAFMMWVMAFGNVAKNHDKATMGLMPVVYAKDRKTDIPAATAKPWYEFADSKEEAVKKAFDLQGATMALLKRAAAAGVDHTKLVAMAGIAGIAPEKVPASVKTGEAAEKAVETSKT